MAQSSSQWRNILSEWIRFLIRSFFPDFRPEDSGRSEHVHQFDILGPGVPAVPKDPAQRVLNNLILSDPLLLIWDVYPGSWFRIFPSRIQSRKDSNKLLLSSRKYDPGCSSRIRIYSIPDPGVKKAPDLGSGSEHCFDPNS